MNKTGSTGDTRDAATPILPRRAFVAALLSAVTAGGAVALAALGGVTGSEARSFAFSRGTALASGQDVALRGFLARAVGDDRVHVTILGHTGQSGDAAANLTLSEARAETVAAMARDMGLDPSRLTVTGVGGGQPLPKQSGESDRAHQSRQARVEIILQVRR